MEKIEELMSLVGQCVAAKDTPEYASHAMVLRLHLEEALKPKRVCRTCGNTGRVSNLHNWRTGGKRSQDCWECAPYTPEKTSV